MKTLFTTSLIGALCITGVVIAQDATQQEPQAATPSITLMQAQDIALGQVAGEITEVEFEKEDGKSLFEIEIATADGTYSEVTIDAASGEILATENRQRDDDDDDWKDEKDCDDKKEDRKRS